MSRRIFSFVSLLSLLLCLATVVLWVRSYWVSDWVAHFYGPETETSFFRDSHRHMVPLRLTLMDQSRCRSSRRL